MGNKVYVLICESVLDGVKKITTKVFSKRSKVHKEMRECYNSKLEEWKHSYDDKWVMLDKGDNYRGIWLMSDFEHNHIIWLIEEQEVIE